MHPSRLSFRLLALAAAASLACTAAVGRGAGAPAAVHADGFTFVKSAGGIAEYTLDANKLSVLLMEDHSAPVVTFMVTYHVGSRNEVTGTTGATHLLEHLMFKGSVHYNRDLGTGFDTMLDRIGATNNATTGRDRTDYFEDLASDHLELAVKLESDRMRGLLLREEDRRTEMTVVRNEFERGENDPIEALDKEINAAAFVAFPYHHPTIGWRSDIEQVPIEKLRAFYDTFYWPNNATVTLVGDFQPAEALALLAKYYGPIPPAPHPLPAIYTEEPAQQGPRRVVVKRTAELGAVAIAFKIPAALHPDYPALDVLADILADGRTSRLYRALVDENLAVSVDAYAGFTHDPSLFTIYVRLSPGTPHAEVEKVVLAQLAQLKAEGATPAEVARALSKEAAAIAYGRDGSGAIASQINEDIAVGDWTYFLTLPKMIQAVTAAAVTRVAQIYLVEDQSTTGWFVPLGAGPGPAAGEAAAPPPARSLERQANFYRDPTLPRWARPAGGTLARDEVGGAPAGGGSDGEAPGALIAPHVVRRTLAGIDVLTLKTTLQDVVTIRGSLPAGEMFNPPGNTAVADLVAGLLDKGTAKHDKLALAQALEDLGASISFDTTPETLSFSARCLKRDVPAVMGLLAEQLRTPLLAADELAKLKKQIAGEYEEQMDDTNFRAEQALERAVFPAGHPNHPPEADRYLSDLAAATAADVKVFHDAHYGPSHLKLVAVGDVDDAAIGAALQSAFGGWTGGTAVRPVTPAPPLPAGRVERIAMPGKASVSAMLGQPTDLKYTDPDRIALAAATQVLGGGYFSSRLLSTVRNQEGLTYGIFARVGEDTYTDGIWMIQATFAPALLDQGLASTRRELERFVRDGVTADEWTVFKGALAGSYKLALATSAGVANQLLANLERGLPLSAIDDYPRKIDALTVAQLNSAVKRHLDPDRMIMVLAGSLPAAPANAADPSGGGQPAAAKRAD